MTDRAVFDACKAVNLVDLIGAHTKLTKIGAREWAGACPKCGGRDRLRVNLDRGWFCRQCQGEPGGGSHWHDQLDFVMWLEGLRLTEAVERLTGRRQIDRAELERIAADRQHREQERAEHERMTADEAARRLTDGAEWKAFAEHPAAVEKWAARGVQKSWVEYYGLGYCADREFFVNNQPFHSDSLTIPYHRAVYSGDEMTSAEPKGVVGFAGSDRGIVTGLAVVAGCGFG